MIWLLACFLSPIGAILVAAACYPRVAAAGREGGISEDLAGRFVAGVVSYDLAFGVAGYILGFVFFCLLLDAGELCGLGAVFITAPLGFDLGVAWFLFKSLRRAPAHG